MRVPGRVVLVRSACIAALAASAALTADRLHPDRGFCPLAAACERARSSALGSVLGIPTSVVGLGAFALLFLLTLLPARAARRAGRPAALLGALAGLGFVAYQAFVLRAFCPLCLVADLSALVAGAAAVGWPVPPVSRSPKRKSAAAERVVARLRWALVAQLAVAAPLLWPHPPSRPSWVPLPQAVAFEPDASAADAAGRTLPSPPPAAADLVATPPAPRFEPLPTRGDSRSTSPSPPPAPVPSPPQPSAPEPVPAPPPVAPAPVREATPVPDPPAAPAPAPSVRTLALVEYLNPFCAHCRATHARLERVLASVEGPVRRQRVYVWATREAPAWARACACAQAQGREEALFQELLRTSGQDASDVLAAAGRAGLDVPTLRSCMASASANPRLERDRRRVEASRIEGLPTLDIGRRRLMGEQSEAELREAIHAALSDLP